MIRTISPMMCAVAACLALGCQSLTGPDSVDRLHLIGEVTVASSGLPVEGAEVYVLVNGSGFHCGPVCIMAGPARTLADGTFSLSFELNFICSKVGDWYVSVGREGHRSGQTAPGSIRCTDSPQRFDFQLFQL